MMESTHGAIADAPPPSENGSMTQTTYFDADPPPEAEGEAAQEPAYVSFTVGAPRSNRNALTWH